MREIKFRAWDEENEIMQVVLEEEHKFKSRYVNSIISDPSILLLQYTGLKDKNGKEIYEGDIVASERTVVSDQDEPKNCIEVEKHENFEYANGSKGTRYFGRRLVVVEWKDSSCGFEPFSDSEENCGHCGCGREPRDLEVIGNIYENKELLK